MSAHGTTAQFSYRLLEQAAVVDASGELDATTVPAFRRQVEHAVLSGTPLVIVSMSRVQFLDSSGLAALVGVNRKLPPGTQLALADVPTRMQRVLRVAAVSTLLTVHEEGQPWPWPHISHEDVSPGPQGE